MRATTAFLCFSVLCFLIFPSYVAHSEKRVRIYELAATENYVIIPVRIKRGKSLFYVHRFSDGSTTKLISSSEVIYGAGKSLISPNDFYLVSHNQSQSSEGFKSTLWKCHIAPVRCAAVLQSEEGMSAPIELENGSFLLSKGRPEYRPNAFSPTRKRLIFADKDFYVVDAHGEMNKITDFRLPVLGSASLIGGRIVFRASGTTASGQNIGNSRGYHPKGFSEIYSFDFDDKNDVYGVIDRLAKPFVKFGSKIDTHPSAIMSPTIVAFSSADSGVERTGGGTSGWRYEIVVQDFSNKRILHRISPNFGRISNPSVTPDGDVYYFQYDSERFELLRLDIPTGLKNRVLRDTWSGLDNQSVSFQIR